MKNCKIKYFSVLLVLIALLSASIFFPFKKYSFFEGKNGLNLSAGEINIITPENKTYIEPMSGYYPATYSFENDENGLVPEGWIDLDGSGAYSQIISEFDGHNNVLQQIDNSAGLGAVVRNVFSSKIDHGTIEFYTQVSSMTAGTKMSWWLWSDSGYEIWFLMQGSKLEYNDGGTWHDIISSGLTANTWYHFSVRWRSTGAPAYEGLSEGEWKIFVDEVEYGNYALVHDDNMTLVNLETGPFPYGFNVYWDAVGFDWKDDYAIGDNLNEGLLVSFDNAITTDDWLGYSLDSHANVTILGNKTISMPSDGTHNIQVFGNSTLGTYYHSDIRYFSVDIGSPEITIITPHQDEVYGDISPNYEISILNPYIDRIWYTLNGGITNITALGLIGTIDQTEWDKIGFGQVSLEFYANDSFGYEGYAKVSIYKNKFLVNSPENKTYSTGMTGYYPATYGFENDEDGDFPMEFIDDSVGASSEVVVESEMAGHKKILHYNSLVYTYYARSITNLSSSQTSGSIEYYVYKESGEGGFEISLRNSTGDYALRIGIDYMDDGLFVWRTSGLTAQQFGAGKYSDNTWFHLRIDFDIPTKKFDIYLDGVKEVDQEDLFYDINSVQHVRCDQTGSYSSWYLDALSFSWDENYVIGDNIYEGLLLSFESTTTFDWWGYSLDSQINKTILGNTTIQFPDNGMHTIQIFGNNSMGSIYHSDVRYFSVDSNPQLTIISPNQDDFFGVLPPNFEISIVEPNLDTIWYTLDDGMINKTFIGLTGTIDQTEWDKIVVDIVTIKFYANDSFGHEGYAEVGINKDLIVPVLTIVQDALIFTVTADDGSGSGIASIWYRINGSAWIEYTTPFELDYGFYNITTRAFDEVGNIGYSGLIIALREPYNPDDPFDWTIIIMSTVIIGGLGLAAVITIIIRKRK